MKGLLSATKRNFIKFGLVRLAMQTNGLVQPFIIANTLAWIQNREEEPLMNTIGMVAYAMLVPLLTVIIHIIWEYFAF